MKSGKSPIFLKYTALAAGLIGCGLRIAVYTAGTDIRRLPVSGHWSQTGLWILTAAVFTLLLCLTRSIPDSAESDSGRCIAGGIGCLAAALAFFLADTPDTMGGAFRSAELVLRCGAALSLCGIAFCRFAGRRPFFLLHGVVCLYLALRMISLYRIWSSDPQLIDYGFYLGAYIAAILTAYQFAAIDADCGNHRKLWFWSLVSVYLCGVSLSGNQEPLFLLLCMIWILTNLRYSAAAAAEADPEGV